MGVNRGRGKSWVGEEIWRKKGKSKGEIPKHRKCIMENNKNNILKKERKQILGLQYSKLICMCSVV